MPIYEVSETQDRLPFFSMKFAAGGSLLDATPILRNDQRPGVALMAKVSRAVHYAHSHGILHRDLKPGNILLDGCGEPLVSDFGLAKWLDTSTDLTRTLTIFGTPGYIAPEQAKRSAEKLGPAADVYSLGAILFDIFTGRPPFLGDHALAVIQQASEKPAPKLRSLAPEVDRDLETICAHCLEREPTARYQSAAALADDLECWVEGKTISARRVLPPMRIWRWSLRNRMLTSTTIVCLSLAAAVAWLLHNQLARVSKIPLPEKSIAVLPFENLSSDRQNFHFADGVQDEILTDLARVADLKVISRSSVMRYKSGIARDLREIGRQLGVAHVVEGSVQWSGNRVRVNAQLLDARTDRSLWGQTYNGDLSDVFTIQSEIAKAIAEQLQATLSLSEKRAIERPPTTDVTAFDLYTHAKILLLRTGIDSNERTNLLQAADLLNQAIARDSSFFGAYYQLAQVHDNLYFLGHDPTAARLALAETAIQAASRLRPEAGETHLARAWNLYMGSLDYDGAWAELASAQQTLPNDPQLFVLKALIERRQRRWEEAIRSFERAVELDPYDSFTLQQVARTYEFLLRYAQAKSVWDRILTIKPNDPYIEVERALVDLNWRADTRPLHQVIDRIRTTNPVALPRVADEWLLCALCERDAEAAKNALITLGENRSNLAVDISLVLFSRLFIDGVIARMTKDDDKAQSAFTSARAEQEKTIHAQPNYGPALCLLGLIDAGLGR
jgi:serine/threonine-protein kinase